jgi:regulator of replication initiation timing
MLSYERRGKVEVKVSQKDRNTAYGVKYFFREIIEDFLNDFSSKVKKSGFTLDMDNILQEIDPPKDKESLEKSIVEEAMKKKEPPKKEEEKIEITKTNVDNIVQMGFTIGSAVYALYHSKNNSDGAVNLLLSNI